MYVMYVPDMATRMWGNHGSSHETGRGERKRNVGRTRGSRLVRREKRRFCLISSFIYFTKVVQLSTAECCKDGIWTGRSFLWKGPSWIASRSPARWLNGARGLWYSDSNTPSVSAKARGAEGARQDEGARRDEGRAETIRYLAFFWPLWQRGHFVSSSNAQATFSPATNQTLNKPCLNK